MEGLLGNLKKAEEEELRIKKEEELARQRAENERLEKKRQERTLVADKELETLIQKMEPLLKCKSEKEIYIIEGLIDEFEAIDRRDINKAECKYYQTANSLKIDLKETVANIKRVKAEADTMQKRTKIVTLFTFSALIGAIVGIVAAFFLVGLEGENQEMFCGAFGLICGIIGAFLGRVVGFFVGALIGSLLGLLLSTVVGGIIVVIVCIVIGIVVANSIKKSRDWEW